MVGKTIPVIAAFMTNGNITPMYAKIQGQDGAETVHFEKVDLLEDRTVCRNNFLYFRCMYAPENSGVYREIVLCYHLGEHIWSIDM